MKGSLIKVMLLSLLLLAFVMIGVLVKPNWLGMIERRRGSTRAMRGSIVKSNGSEVAYSMRRLNSINLQIDCASCYVPNGQSSCVEIADSHTACEHCLKNPWSWHCDANSCMGNRCAQTDCDQCYVPNDGNQCVAMFDSTSTCHACEKNPTRPHCGSTGCVGHVCITSTTTTTTTVPSGQYVPGTPGAAWTQEEVLAVKAKLWRIFATHEAHEIYNKLKPNNKYIGWADYMRPAAKMLRLGFHDCYRYPDGSGGCDGCLAWHGMGKRYGETAGTWSISPSDTLDYSVHNGLEPAVEMLEAIYKDRSFPARTTILAKSLYDSGKSRADLWALATIVAVEYGIEVNNGVCADPDYEFKHHGQYLNFNGGRHCHHLQGQPDCKVNLPRPFTFTTGRKDCVTDMAEGYMASQREVSADAQLNGQGTARFFEKEFGFTGRETVAIMGAHTMGRHHHGNSLFKYLFVKNGGMMFNNQYYRNIVGKNDYRFVENSCDQAGDAEGNAPMARWVANVRMDMTTGGPAQFIQEKWICPEVCATANFHSDPCCTGKGTCKASCMGWRLALGLDEVALPADMGLYLDFNLSDTKLPTGCPGLKHFTAEEFRKSWTNVWSGPAVGVKGVTDCPKQKLALPSASTPLNEIFEEYANSQAAWVRDFVPALEKMLANGYASGELQVAPSQWTDVVCPEQDSRNPYSRFWICYSRQGLSSPFMLKSMLDNRVIQESSDGAGWMSMWQSNGGKPASLSQIWQKTSSGDHFVNMASGKVLVIHGQGSWTWSSTQWTDKLLVGPDGAGLDRGWGQEDGGILTSWTVHGAVNQQWEMLPVEDSVVQALRSSSSPSA